MLKVHKLHKIDKALIVTTGNIGKVRQIRS